mgnify:FL=1
MLKTLFMKFLAIFGLTTIAKEKELLRMMSALKEEVYELDSENRMLWNQLEEIKHAEGSSTHAAKKLLEQLDLMLMATAVDSVGDA